MLLMYGQAFAWETSDLNGCYQPANSSILEYYCFDGAGGYYYETWNQVSGCTGALEQGQYQLQGNTLIVCDSTGCSQYTVDLVEGGMSSDGEYYNETPSCN